jgi:hypothetical protein
MQVECLIAQDQGEEAHLENTAGCEHEYSLRNMGFSEVVSRRAIHL